MTENIPSLPKSVGDSIEFTGPASGSDVVITRRSSTDFEVRYVADPTYVARLEEDRGSYFLHVPAGVTAVGGGWDEWRFFHNHF